MEFRIAMPQRGHEPTRQQITAQGPRRVYAPNEDDPQHFLGMIKAGMMIVDVDEDVRDWIMCLKRNALNGFNHVVDVVMEDEKGRLRILCDGDEDDGEIVKEERGENVEREVEMRGVSIEGSDETSEDEAQQQQQEETKKEPPQTDRQDYPQSTLHESSDQQIQNESRQIQMSETPKLLIDRPAIIQRRKLDDEESEFRIRDDTPIPQETPLRQIASPEVPLDSSGTTVIDMNRTKYLPREPDTSDFASLGEVLFKKESSDVQQYKKPPYKRRRRLPSQQQEYNEIRQHRVKPLPPRQNRPPPHSLNQSPSSQSSLSSRISHDRYSSFSPPSHREEFVPRRASIGSHVRPPQIRYVSTNPPPHYQRMDTWRRSRTYPDEFSRRRNERRN